MAGLQDLRTAIDHITACTGDKDAWRRDLSSADLAAISATVIDPAAGTELLAKIRANHPTLFDPRTGAQVTPAPAERPGQSGGAADAMKAAEDALVRQTSRSAEVDLQVITAIANAHSETEQGTQRLRQLQTDIENAVRTRVDLDTPAGARDFQRYLVGKLREIGAVIESAGLDSSSKAALAGAWTVLYRSAAHSESTPADPAPAPALDSPERQPAAPIDELPPYGVDSLPGPAAEGAGGVVSTIPASGQSSPAAVPAPQMPLLPGTGGAPPFPLSAATAPLPGLTAGIPRSQPEPLYDSQFPGAATAKDRALADLLDVLSVPNGEHGDGDAVDNPMDETIDDQMDETFDAPLGEEAPPDPGAATRVPLPDGSTVSAPSVALANVMRAALAGTPVPEAFGTQGITVPPPGSAVGLPVDPSRVVAGDVGMFMEQQALALDSQRAWLGGRVQPVGAVTGPSFLGWLHPPAPTAVQTHTASPTTAPAAAPGTAR